MNTWRLWGFAESSNPVNYWCEMKHARNKVISRCERTGWPTFVARVLSKDKKSAMATAVERAPLLALPAAYQPPILRCFDEMARRSNESDESVESITKLLADAKMIRAPFQLYHKVLLKRLQLDNQKPNPAHIWGQVRHEFDLLPTAEKASYENQFERLVNLRRSHGAAEAASAPARSALCDRVCLALCDGIPSSSAVTTLALSPADSSLSLSTIDLQSVAERLSKEDLALMLCPSRLGQSTKPVPEESTLALPGGLGRRLSEFSMDELVRMAASVQFDIALHGYLMRTPEPVKHCLRHGVVMDPRADAIARPLADQVLDQHLSKKGAAHYIPNQKKKGEAKPTFTRVTSGAAARQLDFTRHCRGVSADRGVVKGPGKYNHTPCGLICSNPARAGKSGQNKARMKLLMAATWKRIVRCLGGAAQVSCARHLFAFESWTSGLVQEQVQIGWLAVCNGCPWKFYVVVTLHDMVDAIGNLCDLPLPIADYAGIVVQLKRHDYVQSKRDSAASFAATRGRLYHQTQNELTDRLTSGETHNIILRKLSYRPLDGEKTEITGVEPGVLAEVLVPQPKPAPKPVAERRRRGRLAIVVASERAWGDCFDSDGANDDESAVAAALGPAAPAHAPDPRAGDDVLPLEDYALPAPDDAADPPDLDASDPVGDDPVLAAMRESFPTIEGTLRKLADDLLAPTRANADREDDEVRKAEEARAAGDRESMLPSIDAAHVGAMGAWDNELATSWDLHATLQTKFKVEIVETFSPSMNVVYNVWNAGMTVKLGFIYELGGSLRAVCCRDNHIGCDCFINSWGTMSHHAKNIKRETHAIGPRGLNINKFLK